MPKAMLIQIYKSINRNYHNVKKPKPRRKATKPYTKGELNKLIDNLCHPLFQENPSFILIDSLLHGLVEQNPPQTVRKFIQYNLPKLIEALKRETQE